MKAKVLAVMVLLLFLSAAFLFERPVSGEAVAGDTWSQVASLPGPPSYGLVASAVDGKIYAFSYNYSECYNPQTNSWTTITIPPSFQNNGYTASVELQNKIFLMSRTVQVYDPPTGNWTSKASVPGISGWRAVAVDDKIFLIGGISQAGPGFVTLSNKNYVYDPTVDSWSTMAPIPTAVARYASAVINDKIYIIGGAADGQHPDNATNLVQIFDPSTNNWTDGPSIPTGVFASGSCTTTGLLAPERIYVVGGSTYYDWGFLMSDTSALSASNLNQVYDPTTGTWSTAAPLSNANRYFSLVNVGDIFYAVGGLNGNSNPVLTMEKYTPVGYSPPTPSPTTQPTATPTSINTSPLTNSTLIAIAIIAVLVLAGVTSYLVLLRRHRKTR
jgi:N-acetylneuraminic acid mutarotase